MTAITDTQAVPEPAGAHHLDGDLAARIPDALDVARQWADWAAIQLDAWIRTDAACVNATSEDTAPEAAQRPLPKLFSTTFIQLAIAQSRAYREIAAEERAGRQAGVLAGALPPNALAALPSEQQVPFGFEESAAAIDQLPASGQT